MDGFNNEAYQALVSDLVNDAFYLDGVSKRGVIAKIRQYTEVLVRKILNLPSKAAVELGNGKLQHKLKEKNNPLLIDAVKTINKIGSECTHTNSPREITDGDVKITIDCLFNLYASLLIDFFGKYEFGSNNDIVRSFSLLPPIIRYITLNYLYDKSPDNLMIIDKLSLVLLKALNEETALCWVEDRKEILIKKHSVTKKGYEGCLEKFGEYFANMIYNDAPNMYDLCVERVTLVAEKINSSGILYHDFESALPYYKEFGILQGTSPDILEFNSIMDFLYLGRRSNEASN